MQIWPPAVVEIEQNQNHVSSNCSPLIKSFNKRDAFKFHLLT